MTFYDKAHIICVILFIYIFYYNLYLKLKDTPYVLQLITMHDFM